MRPPLPFPCCLGVRPEFLLTFLLALVHNLSFFCSVSPLPNADKWSGKRRYPLDTLFIWSLVWQQRQSIFIAFAALLFCVASNLASPVISGALFETLVQGQPFSKWVGAKGPSRPAAHNKREL